MLQSLIEMQKCGVHGTKSHETLSHESGKEREGELKSGVHGTESHETLSHESEKEREGEGRRAQERCA